MFAHRMEITADYAKGASGGPVMDDWGNMVAMVSSIRSIFYSNQPPYNQISLFKKIKDIRKCH